MNQYNNKETAMFIFRSCGDLAGTERVVLNWCTFIDFKKTNIIVCADKGDFWKIFQDKVPYVQLIDFVFDSKVTGITKFINSFKFFEKTRPTKVIWLFNGMDNFSLLDMLISWFFAKRNLYISHHAFPENINKIKTRLWFGLIPGIGLWKTKRILKIYLEHLLAKKILAVSNEVGAYLKNRLKVSQDKIVVSNVGIDTNFFYFNEDAKENVRKEFNFLNKGKVFIAINRFARVKRIDRLLGAFFLLSRENQNICLLIAGEGKLKNLFSERVEKNKFLRERVKFIGFRQDINRFIQGADFLLLASDNEGQSNVIKEAMACGTIPIVTDTPGTKEISDSIFISQRNVFDFYQKIKFVTSLLDGVLHEIRENIIKEVKEKYDLQRCSQREISIFDLPQRNNYA